MTLVFRSLGMTLLCMAVATLAFDGVKMLANGGLSLSSLKDIMIFIDEAGFAAWQAELQASMPYVWTTVLLPLMVFPAWIVLGGLGSVLFLIGYRPKPPEIVADL